MTRKGVRMQQKKNLLPVCIKSKFTARSDRINDSPKHLNSAGDSEGKRPCQCVKHHANIMYRLLGLCEEIEG